MEGGWVYGEMPTRLLPATGASVTSYKLVLILAMCFPSYVLSPSGMIKMGRIAIKKSLLGD